AYREHGYGGIGFVFTPEDDLCGVDLDGCLDPETGEIESWASTIIEELGSYTEISPSGTGVHVLVRATLPEGRNRKGRFEAYDRSRYFTVTGKHLAGTPQAIAGRQEELRTVVRRVFGEESTNGHTKPVANREPVDNGLSDDEIIRKALAASNGERFSRLWNGDAEEYGSHSEADLALCGMLAFWTGGDASRTDAMFRQSGLYRKKWNRKDYRNRTITEALSGKTEFYQAPKTVKLADGTERKIEELQPEEIGRLLSSVEPEEVSWLWPSWLALGKLALVDGDPGLGKSAMTLDLAARVSAGKAFPDGAECEPAGVVLLSAEDGLADTIRPRLDAAGADTSKILALATVPDEDGHDRLLSIPEDLGHMEKGIRRVGARLVVVDPLMAFLSGDTKSHRDQDVRRALAPLAGLAEKTGAAVLVVRHLNKAAANNPLYRGGGSIGIIGAARMAFVVGKDPQDENRRVLASTKNNLSMPPASLMFGLEEAESGSVRVNWLGQSEVSAKDILATPQDQEHADARSEAVEFLNEVLVDGPVAASQVKEEAEDAGISERTLARAKKAVGVISYREGEAGKRGKGQWLWKLPVVDLVDGDIKDASAPIKDAKGRQDINGGILNHSGGIEEAESCIDKRNVLRMPTTVENPLKDANSIKDARMPTLENVRILNECVHGYESGKGCYLCDPDHPYRRNGSVS
ncbi:MAG: AAA family ATPase, partial [Rubrobacteraceae bacterium]|nr:AAA family ATPase [Rubrobacteraceae bacterium]